MFSCAASSEAQRVQALINQKAARMGSGRGSSLGSGRGVESSFDSVSRMNANRPDELRLCVHFLCIRLSVAR
jgi:hypothetical protein